MATIAQLRKDLTSGLYAGMLKYLYCTDEAGARKQAQRYLAALDRYCEIFGDPGEREVCLFSTPGRTEVGGNHTDHQHGRVLAAGVNLDVIAVVTKNDTGVITVKSEGFAPDTVRADELDAVPAEKNTSAALIRGTCAGFERRGFQKGGFDAYTTSNVLKGSGLSSSAAFEVLLGNILNHLYNGGRIDPVTLAKNAQFAENAYFGKPCGLMDQTACAVGGFVSIDFADPEKPLVSKVDFDFSHCGHSLVIVDTKGDHADLTGDYASIGEEMRGVAAYFGKTVLREVDEEEFFSSLGRLRGKLSDRAILRAIHFFSDNRIALEEADALRRKDFDTFKKLIIRSGQSSFMYLQNAYSLKNPSSQGIPLGIAASERLLKGKGAWRVHGGGFAGTMQAFVPNEMVEEYKGMVESLFGEGSCYVLSIRPVGAIRLERD